MKKYLFLLILPIMLFSCEDSETKTDNKQRTLEESIINLPDSISKVESRSTSDSIADEVYEGIRGTIGMIEGFSELAQEITYSIQENILDSGESSGDWDNSGGAADEPARVTWKPDPTGEYDTIVDVYALYEGEPKMNMRVLLSATDTGYRGSIILDARYIPDEPNTFKLQVDFDGTETIKTLDIYAVDLSDEDEEEVGSPTTVWIEATEDGNGVISLKGSYYTPVVDPKLYVNDPKARVYSFTAVAKIDANAVLKLALPHADVTDTDTLWDEYSVSAVVKDLHYPELKDSLSEGGLTVSALEEHTKLDFEGETIESLTDGDIDALLKWFAGEESDVDLDAFIFITELVNPAYYSPDGFLGTFNGSEGTLSSAPAWAPEYNIDSITPLVPKDVADLEFDEDNFIIK
ncbi:MAG: hypothetical protein PF637_07490 [Spirochaetes bacterium]|nr:hypothetical protein [Spirochaetota bacterium]